MKESNSFFSSLNVASFNQLNDTHNRYKTKVPTYFTF